jgi:putative phosphoribosyl transferase
MLNQANFSTFLFDLLTKEEETIDVITAEFRFNIELLSERLILVTEWLRLHAQTADLNIGYFGASTGAAAALIAAAKLTTDISAIVSRGGRPDLAIDYLKDVKAPTLLIVGQLDYEVIELNEFAYKNLNCEKKISIVPGATHLFEEDDTLQQAANLAIDWFKIHE